MLSFSAFSSCRSTSRIDDRYSSSFRLSVGPERRLQLLGVGRDEIEDAAAVPRAADRSSSGVRIDARAEQPLEEHARIEDRRQRLRLAPPRQVVGVGAGVAGVAIAGLARVVHAELERREARLVADLVGDDLIAGDARLDVDGGLADLDAGQIRPGAAAVIAGAVEQRAAAVVASGCRSGSCRRGTPRAAS